MNRLTLLLILATMPDEAFGWFVAWASGVPGVPMVYPDGLGGFQPASRTSIEALRTAAREALEVKAPAADGSDDAG